LTLASAGERPVSCPLDHDRDSIIQTKTRQAFILLERPSQTTCRSCWTLDLPRTQISLSNGEPKHSAETDYVTKKMGCCCSCLERGGSTRTETEMSSQNNGGQNGTGGKLLSFARTMTQPTISIKPGGAKVGALFFCVICPLFKLHLCLTLQETCCRYCNLLNFSNLSKRYRDMGWPW